MAIIKNTNTRFGMVSSDDIFIFNESYHVKKSDDDYIDIVHAKLSVRHKIDLEKKRGLELGIQLRELFKVYWTHLYEDKLSYQLRFVDGDERSVWNGAFYVDRPIIKLIERIGDNGELPIRLRKIPNIRRW